MNRPGMTAGDLRAEADRLSKARGAEYEAGYKAGLERALLCLNLSRDVLDSRYESKIIEGYDLAIECIGEEVPR